MTCCPLCSVMWLCSWASQWHQSNYEREQRHEKSHGAESSTSERSEPACCFLFLPQPERHLSRICIISIWIAPRCHITLLWSEKKKKKLSYFFLCLFKNNYPEKHLEKRHLPSSKKKKSPGKKSHCRILLSHIPQSRLPPSNNNLKRKIKGVSEIFIFFLHPCGLNRGSQEFPRDVSLLLCLVISE